MFLCVGQVVKDVVDSERCRHVLPGDVLVAVNDVAVSRWSHDDVVNLLRGCRSRRVARLTLMTSCGTDVRRPVSAMASPQAVDGFRPHVDYNQLYREMYSPVPFTSVTDPNTTQTRSSDARTSAARAPAHSPTSKGEPDVVPTSRYSAPDMVDGLPSPRRPGIGRRREPRRSLPSVDLLSPVAARRISREPSQSSLNFSGTPDFIPASAYLENDERRRRATGRPSIDHELAALTLDERDHIVNSSPLRRDDSFHSDDTDDASVPSSGSGLPATSPTTSGHRAPAVALIGTGNESCNSYNARTAAVHSSAPVRHHPPVERHRHRSQSSLADPVGPGAATLRGHEDDDHEHHPAPATSNSESRYQRNTEDSAAPLRLPEPKESSPESRSRAVVATPVSSSYRHRPFSANFFNYFYAHVIITHCFLESLFVDRFSKILERRDFTDFFFVKKYTIILPDAVVLGGDFEPRQSFSSRSTESM